MKERPILFSTPMVQAILNGEKTQTRRIIAKDITSVNKPNTTAIMTDDGVMVHFKCSGACESSAGYKNKYGQPGDLLYVRETWIDTFIPNTTPVGGFYYKADHPQEDGLKWRPSIHMPKSKARIWLQVEEVKVERLKDISEEGIIAEGVRIPVNGIGTNSVVFKLGVENSAFSFLPDRKEGEKYNQSQLLHAFWAELWCELNGRASWDMNPWVWAVKFNVISTTGKPQLETKQP